MADQHVIQTRCSRTPTRARVVRLQPRQQTVCVVVVATGQLQHLLALPVLIVAARNRGAWQSTGVAWSVFPDGGSVRLAHEQQQHWNAEPEGGRGHVPD